MARIAYTHHLQQRKVAQAHIVKVDFQVLPASLFAEGCTGIPVLHL